jgi:hypothetical protein
MSRSSARDVVAQAKVAVAATPTVTALDDSFELIVAAITVAATGSRRNRTG